MKQVINRSAIETLYECEQKRFFQYDYAKKGIVSTRSLFDTDIGIALHDAILEVFRSEGEYRYTHKADLNTEDNVLIEGHIFTFLKDIYPVLIRDYDVVSLEDEWKLDIQDTNFQLALRMDAILRHKATGQLEIFDWKTKKALGWIKDVQYKFNLQTALYTWALEQKTKEDIRGITYIIFEKGDVKLDRSKTFEQRIRQSPYCYGYKSPHGAYQSKWAKGWEKFAVWTEFDVEKWVYNVMDEEDRRNTFLVLPELKLDPNVRQTMITQAFQVEEKYRTFGVQNPVKNHQACYKYGEEHQCPYIGVCWYNGEVTKEAFTERVDHHSEKD